MPNVLFIYAVLCFMVAYMGRKTKLGMLRTLLLSFLLTPPIVLIYLLLFAALEQEGKPTIDRLRGR